MVSPSGYLSVAHPALRSDKDDRLRPIQLNEVSAEEDAALYNASQDSYICSVGALPPTRALPPSVRRTLPRSPGQSGRLVVV